MSVAVERLEKREARAGVKAEIVEVVLESRFEALVTVRGRLVEAGD